MFKKSLIFAGAATALMAVCGTAGAVSYTLNVPNGLNYGTVNVTESSGTVTIDALLSPGYNFVDTGAHYSFGFNYNSTLTGFDITTPSGTEYAMSGDPSPYTQPGFGSFSYALACSTCQGGNNSASPNNHIVMTFGGSLANFFSNNDGFMFTADVYGPDATGAPFTFAVGNGTGTSVPEPASLALFGLGLAGLGLARRRRV